MKKILLSLFILVAATATAQWQYTNGPFGAGVISFATNATYIFAGTEGGGVYRSSNNGISWEYAGLASDPDPASFNGPVNVNSLAIMGSDLFAGTFGAGLFRSPDNGTTWTPINNGPFPLVAIPATECSSAIPIGSYWELAVKGTDLFVGGQGTGVFRTSDKGATWTAVNNGLPTSADITGLVVIGSSIFAAPFGSGIYRSDDNGGSWSPLNGEPAVVQCLAVSGTTLFAGGSSRVFRSTDNGATWTTLNNGAPITLNANPLSLLVDGSNIYAGFSNGTIFKSTDNGNSWTPVNNGLPANTYESVNGGFIEALALKNATLFAGSEFGLFRSVNGGANWTAAVAGMSVPQIRDLAAANTALFAATRMGIFRSSDNGASWDAINTGFLAPGASCFLVSGNTIFAGGISSTTVGGNSALRPGVYRSTDNGNNWQDISSGFPAPSASEVSALVSIGSDLFAGVRNLGVFRSTNNGTSWTAMNNGLTNQDVESLVAIGTNLFAATHAAGVFRSTDNGANWTAVNSGLSSLLSSKLIANGSTVFASMIGVNGGIFRSTDNGANWIKVDGLFNSPSGVNLAVLRAADGNSLFVSGPDGVYFSSDNGSSWSTNGLQGTTSILINNDIIYASTVDGVWNRPFSEFGSNEPIPNVTIAANPGNNIIIGTSVTFTATPLNAGANPGYQWKLNGNNVGTNSNNYTNNKLVNSDRVWVVMASSSGPVSSNAIFIGVSASPLIPTVTITANPGNTVCSVTSITFTATPIHGGDNPTYQWKINGNNVGTGGNTFTSSNLANGDRVSVALTSDLFCADPAPASSNIITITVNLTINAPTVIQPTCALQTGTIVANATGSGILEYSLNGGSWQTSNTFSGLAPGNYNIAVRLQSNPSCSANYSDNPVVLNAATGCCTPPTINTPTVTQPTCAVPTGTIVVNATGSGTLQYSLNGGSWQTSSTFSGLAPGNYNIAVRLQSNPTCSANYNGNPVVITAAAGCCTAPIINTPTVIQPTCAISTGTIKVNTTGSGTLQYKLNAGNWQTSSTFSGLVPGNYDIAVRLQSNPSCSANYNSNPVVLNTATGCSNCVLTCPANKILNNSWGKCGANVSYSAVTTGNCGTLTYSKTSGSFFPVGITTVNVSSSTGASCSFTVTVLDKQKPDIICPSDITVTAASNTCSKVVNFTVTAKDNCPGVIVTTVPASGSVFPAGTTTVTATATDASGNKTTSTFKVKVKESSPPVISAKANPIVLMWPANSSYQTINLSQLVTSVTDNCSSVSINSVRIVKVTSDEPENAWGDADGNTYKDIKIADDCKSVDLRRERKQGGNGRVYIIYLSVTDGSGNTGTASCKVIAPANQGGITAIDSGPAYCVYSCCSGGTNQRPLGITVEEPVTTAIQGNFIMEQNYPNPFHTSTVIRYSLPIDAQVSLAVYNQLGQKAAQLTEGNMSAGYHQVRFNATNLAAGIYLCRLQAKDADGKPVVLIGKMMVMK